MPVVVFSDLHLREESADTCYRVLDAVLNRAGTGGHVVFCGDWFQVRYQVGVRLNNLVHAVLQRSAERHIGWDIVPGNHDQVDLSGANALEVFDAWDHVSVWTEPGIGYLNQQVPAYGKFGFMPYRKVGAEGALAELAKHQPSAIFAHLPVHGSVMNNGASSPDGIVFHANMPPVILGHYHKRQLSSTAFASGWPHWQYVGSPYQTSYGEVGNECGVLVLDPTGKPPTFEALDVGAPKHYTVDWDPAVDSVPPARPGRETDKVWLRVRASQSMLVEGKFTKVLAGRGYADVRVSVDPLPVQREVRLAHDPSASLPELARAFARERFADRTVDADAALAALGRWAR